MMGDSVNKTKDKRSPSPSKQGSDDDELDPHRRKKKCQECKSKQFVYVCPGCRIRTCSLECCQSHKKRTGCNGKRDRTEFLRLNQMSDQSLRSDYFFLEDVLNQTAKRQKPNHEKKSHLSKNKKKLQEKARERGIEFKMMPPVMERHKSNSSWYSIQKDTITWKVEVIRIPDQTSVSVHIDEHRTDILDVIRKAFPGDDDSGALLLDSNHHKLFVKAPSSAKTPQYSQIPISSPLNQALRGLTVIEYPTIYMVPPEKLDEFPTITPKIKECAAQAGQETGEVEEGEDCELEQKLEEPASSSTVDETKLENKE